MGTIRDLFIQTETFVLFLGDFSKRISLIRPLKLDGSEYPTWATQDGAPIGSRPPASLSCQVLSPSHTLCGSTQPPDAVPSTSFPWPTPASSPHRPTSSHSSVTPRSPSNA